MDWDLFVKLAAIEYGTMPTDYPYSLNDVLSVFRCFFLNYEKATGERHPPLKAQNIRSVMERLPYTDGGMLDISPESYPEIVEQYFKTTFRGCDYRINHFMSGDIRKLRLAELGI